MASPTRGGVAIVHTTDVLIRLFTGTHLRHRDSVGKPWESTGKTLGKGSST